MKLPDNDYNFLKYLSIIGLPALQKFIPSFFARWGIPYGEQIAGSLNDIAVLIGALICVSVIGYNATKDKTNNYSVDDINNG